MGILGFLVLFPLVIAAALLVVSNDRARTIIVCGAAALIALGSVYLAVVYLNNGASFKVDETVETIVATAAFIVDLLLAAYVIAKAIKYQKWLAIVLSTIQVGIIVYFEVAVAPYIGVRHHLYVDNLSIIMALIIGIIGSGICVYALGYMRDFQREHKESRDRRPVFFAVMFAFLSAMFLLVFSNDLVWLFCTWEITTVCSFALIGFTRTQEAIDNSFRQIVMNIAGGIAFAIALVLIGQECGFLELDRLIQVGASSTKVLLPIALLCFAAATKAAQMPFHSWLLGAMVAPTPTSALLHSSTMVKAGVFLLIKLSPCLGFNAPGIMVAVLGGSTFLLCSLMAISQSNAKRVLAYSTIANLGLITACAGVGTPEAVWAAIFLTIFHAAAKSLLFLCVGTAEHHINSRNIEDMDLLFVRMPRLARSMLLGMMIMFIAPFGMLVSKWAALQSFVDNGNLVLVMLLAFGSAATFFFWAKWIGKFSAYKENERVVEGTVFKSEWIAIALMLVLAIVCCIAFPFLSSGVVVPYLIAVPEWTSSIAFGMYDVSALSADNLLIVGIIALALIIAIVGLPKKTKQNKATVYLSGAGIDHEQRVFSNSFSLPQEATQSNWYLEEMFGEGRLDRFAILIGIVCLAGGILAALIMGGVLI